MADNKSKYKDKHKLIENFQNGEMDAYAYIFEAYYQPLCFYLSEMGIDLFYAEELAQDLFYKIWGKRKDFRDIQSLRSFLYISCRNMALNALDKNKRLKNKKLLHIESTMEESEQPISEHLIYAETILEIHKAISSLPDQCQKVMSLLYIEGLSTDEICKQLAITPSTIYNQKSRGLKLLKKMLKAEHFFILLLLFYKI